MATLTIRHPDGSEQEQELAEQLTVGRADGNDLVLAEGGVSRQHARFFVEGGQVLVEDQQSANGTWVDGQRIEGPTPLSPKAQVVIGDYEIKLKGNGAGARPKTGARPAASKPTSGKSAGVPRSTKMVQAVKADPAAGAALARRTRAQASPTSGPVLRGLTGSLLNKSFALKGTMTVGRVPGVEIQLEDDSVSRKHAEVVVRGKTVVLRDLGSANGTAVNGQPLTEEATLSNGDIIQFGVVEVAFETGEAPPARLARRGGGAPEPRGAPSSRRRRQEEDDELSMDELSSVGMAPKTKRLLLIGGVVLTLLVVGAVVKALSAPPPEVGQAVSLGTGGGPTKLTQDPQQQLEIYLAQCRQFSSPELNEPNWDKAQSSCDKAKDIEPINEEVNALEAKIKKERAAQEHFEKGKKLIQRLREDEALDEFAKIPKDSYYYNQALPIVRDTIEKVKSKYASECKTYFNGGHYPEAAPACENYMKLACQGMTREEMNPPVMKKLRLYGALGRDGWRPKDEMFLLFLKSRDKVDPKAPPWVCPPCPVCPVQPKQPDPCDYSNTIFHNRYKDHPQLSDAMELYCKGNVQLAGVTLQKVKENSELAPIHSQADNMFRDMNTVEQLYKDGQSELSDGRPDRAADPFCEAMALDEKLMLAEKVNAPADERKKELDRMISYFRHNTERDMASHSYQRGKELADRGDRKQACKIWKLGFSFWRGNPDLLKALTNVCTAAASDRLGSAATCDDLDGVLEFAVDGDGNKEAVDKKRAELNCPAPPPEPPNKCSAQPAPK